VRQLAPQDRPREKLARAGVSALGDNELLAIVLGSGVRGRDALTVAREVLELAGGVYGLAHVQADELCDIVGVGQPRAARVLAAIELGRRAVISGGGERPRLTTPAMIGQYLLPLYGGYPVERFGVLSLDAKNHLIRSRIVSIGTIAESHAHPREIYREATIASAAKIVVFHNHPSGDPTASESDKLLTRRLYDAGRIMGIELVDHVILGNGCWYSFRDSKKR
jgi:DNA repair protein RadC